MKSYIPKTLINLGLVFLVLGICFLGSLSPIALASDLELIGSHKGLEISAMKGRLFTLNNLNPGDTQEADLTIKNKYDTPFELFIRAERIGGAPEEGETDLFKQLQLTVSLGDREIYSGSMTGFATSNTSLGEFALNHGGELKAIVHLPGFESGNEFQGKNVDVKWIFTAQAKEQPPDKPEPDKPEPNKPKPPKTGEIIPMGFFGLGVGLMGIGVGIGYRKKK